MNLGRLILLLALLCVPLARGATDPFLDSSNSWGQGHTDLWGLKRIGAGSPAADTAAGGRPVVVAIIDTGLDYFHPDLVRETVWRNPGETLNGKDDDGNGYVDDVIGWDFIEEDNDPWDATGHGTFVAGIVAATAGNGEGIAGVNPRAKIMPLRALNSIGRGYSTRIARAIYYAVDNGARVINLSLAVDRLSQTEHRAVDYAVRKGVVVIAAAGNDGQDAARYSPAGLAGVITVAAVGPDGARAGFSNWGPAVDLAAPGVGILSLRARQTDFLRLSGPEGYRPGAHFVGPGNRYYRADGTSFAAPYVSGVASLVLARREELGPAEVRRILRQSARDIGTPGVDLETGYGLLDARAALDADPAFFVEPAIREVEAVRKANKVHVRVSGTADADRFRAAWIELGQGEEPTTWRRAGRGLDRPVRDGILDDLPAALFEGGGTWTLKLVVEHAGGKRREARHVLNLE